MKKRIYILSHLLVMLTLAACSDTLEQVAIADGEEMSEPVMFTTFVPDVRPLTRSAKDDWEKEVKSYKVVNDNYEFTVEMWKKEGEQTSLVGTSNYKPIYNTQKGAFDQDGTLAPVSESTKLYWQDNVNKWGFKATAGTETLQANQIDQESWLKQDRLIGYSYLPLWDSDADRGTDDFNCINYRTSKQWYADNKTAKDLSGIMAESNADYQKIPLYMQHQRAWITLILKAGVGVEREALKFNSVNPTITTKLYSYGKDGSDNKTTMAIDAWAKEELINYAKDKNGAAQNKVSTTRYDAIIEPYNFLDPASIDKDTIAHINVSNQKFTFAAANDMNYGKYLNYLSGTRDTETTSAYNAMQVYDLKAGQHLTITATLSRESRLILITAWVEDWTETVTQTICDDYGQNGDPILINNPTQLIDFLKDEDKNKAGNVGLIVPSSMSLADTIWVPSEETNAYELKATLNLASTELIIDEPLVKSIARTGSIINGKVVVRDDFSASAAIATENRGTIERVQITTSGELSKARATVGGFVTINYGTIYQCQSALAVEGASDADYVGGIAAKSITETGSGVNPAIEACIVKARVNGSGSSFKAGGGIVGQAEGRVSNNTFEYGITLSQDAKNKNIIGEIGGSSGGGSLSEHRNNSWPTYASYVVGSATITNNYPATTYDAVIDSREELKLLLTSANNNTGKKYRVANSFEVDKEHWIWSTDVLKDEYFSDNVSDGYAHGAVKFKLNGNGKTITLTGTDYATMLFGSIVGEVYDLNILLDKPIVADRIKGEGESDSNTDLIAAFAHSVSTNGKISNITLKAKAASDSDDTGYRPDPSIYIESTTPAGIAVWAKNGGVLTNCISNVPVRMHVVTAGTDARRYAGGIVAVAQKATITQCKYYGNEISWMPGADAPKAQGNNCRYGGIVGGTSEVPDQRDKPQLVLTDCFSWWTLPVPAEGQTISAVMGSVIGSTVYHENNQLINAMADGNAGNWWPGAQNEGAGLMKSGVTVEDAIGKKNSVTPTKPLGW